MSIVSNNIRKYRQLAGMTQLELSLLLGYKSPVSIVKIENGENDIPLHILEQIAKILKLNPIVFFKSDNVNIEENKSNNPMNEYIPYLAKADETTLIAVRKLLDMPPLQEKKSCMEVC